MSKYYGRSMLAAIMAMHSMAFRGRVYCTRRDDPPPKHIQAENIARAEAKRQRRRERNLENCRRQGW